MIRVWQRWVAAISARETGEAMAAVRIASGIALLLNLGSVVGADLVDLIWIDARDGGYRTLEPHGWLMELLGGPTPETVWTLVVATLVAGVCLTIGLGGRGAALVAGQGLLALSFINGHTKGSYDALASNVLWLLVLDPGTSTWSVDCRRRHGRWTSDDTGPAFVRHLVVFQLGVIYLSTGLQKVSAYWTPAGGFSAVYYILLQPSWQRFDMTWVGRVYPLTQIATATTWLWELGAPLWGACLLGHHRRGRALANGNPLSWWQRVAGSSRVRAALVIWGVSLHLGIVALMEVGAFSWIVLAMYPAIFAPAEVAAPIRWAARWVARGAVSPVARGRRPR